MTICDLKVLLSNKDYDSGVVSYNDGEKLGGFNIQEIHGVWRFYLVDDKGNVCCEKRFSKEDDLCAYIIKFIEREHARLIEALGKQKKDREEALSTPNTILL